MTRPFIFLALILITVFGCKQEASLCQENLICQTRVHPNSASGLLVIEFLANENFQLSISVINLNGAVEKSESHSATSGQNALALDLSMLTSDIYIVEFEAEGTTIAIKKIILK